MNERQPKWITKLKHKSLLFYFERPPAWIGSPVTVCLTDERLLHGTLLDVDLKMNITLHSQQDTTTIIQAKNIRFIIPATHIT